MTMRAIFAISVDRLTWISTSASYALSSPDDFSGRRTDYNDDGYYNCFCLVILVVVVVYFQQQHKTKYIIIKHNTLQRNLQITI